MFRGQDSVELVVCYSEEIVHENEVEKHQYFDHS